MPRSLHGIFLGSRPYLPTLALMEQCFDARRSGAIDDVVLLLEHEPVITLGRGAHSENLLAGREQLEQLGVGVVETGRGGDVTLHAPGQLIAYPIIDLSPDRRDVRKYVGHLTEVMRRLVSDHGIDAGTMEGMIGLWADGADVSCWPGQDKAKTPIKLGAIGVRISRWITQHGFALNLTTDLALYQLIVPCGIKEYPVASVSSMTGAKPSVKDAAARAIGHFSELLGPAPPLFSDLSEAPLSQVLATLQSR